MSPRLRIFAAALAVTCAAGLGASPSQAKRAPSKSSSEFVDSLTPLAPFDDTAWVLQGLSRSKRYRLSPAAAESWLERYLRPAQNHTPDWRRYWTGRYGASSWKITHSLSWGTASEPELEPHAELGELRELSRFEPLSLEGVDLMPPWALEAEAFPEPEPLSILPVKPCPKWKQPRPVTVMRSVGERDTFQLLDCDGAVSSEALDRLSVLARPPEAARPELPLPLEPEAGDEWLPEVRLLDPRLVWLVQQVSQAFPGRGIVLFSGYRRDAHSGLHQKGRALDLAVQGVPNEQVFAFCKSLRDVGCGFYPENKFVHVDVRPYGTKRVLWVDVSRPGEPSRYVDGWPGVAEPGSVWLGR